MNKPEYLFHASPNKKIEVLQPRAESVRDQKEGPVIFASVSPAKVSKSLSRAMTLGHNSVVGMT